MTVDEVYALGGSVIDQNFEQLEKLAGALCEGQKVIVVGAGHLKKHQEAVKDEVSKAETDLVGIEATRLNARTLIALMENVHPEVPETVEEVKQAASTGKTVVMGGLNPGFSTDAVASIIAELFDAELYIATDVDGIYEEDPEENPEAQKFDEIEASRLLDMSEGKNEPGVYSIVDETAAGIIKRSGINTKLFEGTIQNLGNPRDADGTRVTE